MVDEIHQERETTAALRGNALPAAAAGAISTAGEPMLVAAPEAGQRRILDVDSARNLKFGFSLQDVTVSIVDVDVVLLFANGGQLVLPSFVLGMISAEPPQLDFAGASVDPQMLIAAAGDVRLVDQLPQITMSDTARPQGGEGPAQQPAPQPQVVQMTATQSFASTPSPVARPSPTQEEEPTSTALGGFGRSSSRQQDDAASGAGGGEGALTERTDKLDSAAQPQPVPQNAPPTITSNGAGATAHVDLQENSNEVTTVSARDPDPGDQIAFAITGGRDAARFAINGVNGKLYYLGTADFEDPAAAGGAPSHEVEVQASDGRRSDTQLVSVRITNVNEAPSSATISASVIAENAATGALVGRIAGVDPDAGAVLRYGFAPGGDAGGRFAIDPLTGDVTVLRGDLFDFEASASQLIVVRITDEEGLGFDKALVIDVLDANDAPIITSNGAGASAAATIAENSFLITTVIASDEDAGSSIRFGIVGGQDMAAFSIDAISGVVTFRATPDFERPADANLDNVYLIEVEATDGLGGADRQLLTITVVNSNDPPDDMTLTGGAVAENAANGTSVGIVQATDPDSDAILRYSFAPGGDAAGRFAIDAVSGELTVRDSGRLDFEAASSHILVIRATDQGGLSLDRAFSVTLTDIDEAPEITAFGGLPSAVLVSGENVLTFATITARDPENAPLSFSIDAGGDAALFQIDAATGVLSFRSSPNFEAPGDGDGDNIFELTVRASDALSSDTQQLFVRVSNVAEAPEITSGFGGASATITVLEDVSLVGTVTATDQDAGSVLRYRISGGADAALFSIDAASGVLTFTSGPDFENPADADGDNSYQLIVEASDGLLTDQQAITVIVANQNDAPIIISDGGLAFASVTVAENSANVTRISATDADAGSSLVYTIAGGADWALFNINSATGDLTFIAQPNFEAPTDQGADNLYAVQVRVFDNAGGSVTQDLSISISDVNEAPTALLLANQVNSIAENTSVPPGGIKVADLTIIDDALGAETLTLSGADAASFQIIGQSLHFIGATPDHETRASYSVSVVLDDASLGGGPELVTNFTLAIGNVNEQPTGLALSLPQAIAENVVGGIAGAITASDPDAGSLFTYGVSDGRFEIVGNSLRLRVGQALDREAEASVTLTITATDQGGLSLSQAFVIAVLDVDEFDVTAPVDLDGTPNLVVENAAIGTAVGITALASDADATSNTVTYSLASNPGGRFAIDASGTVTVASAIDHEATGGSVAITIRANSSDGSFRDEVFSIAVTDLNDTAPVITSAASATVAENSAAVLALTSTDADGVGTNPAVFTITGGADAALFEIVGGMLRFKAAQDFETPLDADGDNIHEVIVQASDGLNSTSRTITVTVADANEAPTALALANPLATVAENTPVPFGGLKVADIAVTDDALGGVTLGLTGADAAQFRVDASGLYFIGAGLNHETKASYSVTVTVDDPGVGASPDASAAFTLTVADVNEAPSAVALAGPRIVAENADGAIIGAVSVTDVDAGDTHGFVVSDARFEVAGGNLRLRAGQSLDREAEASVNLTVTATDQGGLQVAQAFAITVTDLNDTAPVITSAAGATVAENGTAVMALTSTDADGVGTNPAAFTITGGADAALFEIVGGALRFRTAPDFETPLDAGADNSHEVIVQASDGVNSTSRTITVAVTDVNEAPSAVALAGPRVVAENADGAIIGAVSVADVDAGDTHGFVVSDARFEVAGGNLRLRAGQSLDREAEASVNLTVTATDQGGLQVAQAFAITVTDLNDTAPVITSAAGATVAENGTAVMALTSTDADGVGTNPAAFTITGGADAALFEIVGGALRFRTAPDFETPLDAGADNSHEVIVQASDGVNSTSRTITVAVTDVNEAPSAVALAGPRTVAENDDGAIIGAVSVTDVDAGDTHGFVVSDARFEVAGGNLRLRAGQSLDREAEASVNLTVTATDQGGLQVAQAFAITVTDLNDTAPVITSAASALTTENGTAVMALTSTDADGVGANPASFSIIGGADAALFEIVGGALRFKAAPDFEAPLDAGADNSHEVIVQASDGVNSTSRTITVAVTDVNEAPSAVALAGPRTVAENDDGAIIGAVSVTDVDAGDTHGFVVSDARFEVAGGNLRLRAGQSLDREAEASVNLTVTATDQGGLQVAQAFTITVTDLNDTAPVITSAAGATVAENGTAVMALTSTDADGVGTNPAAFTITGGADAALFEIVGGALRFRTAPDFETPLDAGADNSHEVIVQASDGVNSTSRTITVAVSDVSVAFTGDAGDGLHDFSAATEQVLGQGGDGNDTILSGAGADLLAGDSGNDSITSGSGNDTLSGGTGADTLLAGDGDDLLDGGDGHDSMLGGAGNDTFDGGSGDDYMHDNSGIDSFQGGSGIDTVAYITSNPIIIDLQAGLGSAGDAAGDSYAGIENVSGGAADDTIAGDGQDNLLEGGIGGNDRLEGRGGNDTLIGGGGADVLLGGDGSDLLMLDAASLAFPATDAQGDAGNDSVMLTGTASISLAEVLGAMGGVESIDFTAPGVAANLAGFTGADALSLLGAAPGLGNLLTLDIDLGGNDSFSASGFVTPPADPMLPGTYVFYAEAALTTEIARVSVI